MNAALSAGPATATVSIVGGKLQVKSNSGTDIDTDTISSTNPAALASIGFAPGNTSFTPTNLVTQSAVAANQTLTVTIGANPAQTITFGTGPTQIATLTALNTALKGLAGVSIAGTGANNSGDITIAAANTTDTIQVGGTFAPATFGITNTQALPANGTVFGTDLTPFLNESIAGGSITAYNGTGRAGEHAVPLGEDRQHVARRRPYRYRGTCSTRSIPPATNLQPAWVNVGTNFTFNSSGQLTPPLSSLTLNNVVVDGLSLGNVQVAFGSGGLTQFSNTNGTVQVNLLDQNGAAAGQLQSIAVDAQGRIIGTYSNGRTVPLAEVSLANFNGQNNLKQLDGGSYQATADSGPPLLNATGKVVGASLEASNTDIADEFSKLIVTQQAYSANTNIITTTNQMVQDLLNVIR